jgi:hypothetical protein
VARYRTPAFNFALIEGAKDARISYKYFEQLWDDTPRGATLNNHEAMILSDFTVLITGLDTVTRVHDGKPLSARGRVTFIVAKRGSDWKIVHFHRSAMPE